MKKTKFILTMAAMTSLVAFTGCSAEITFKDSESTATPTIAIEASMEDNVGNNQQTHVTVMQTESSTVSQADSVADIFTNPDGNWNYALPGDEEFAYLFEVKYDETTYKEYATITCQGDKGTCWTYETDKYEVGQSSAVELLEGLADCIYINDGGTVTAINITDGKVLWENDDYQGSGSVCTMDGNGNLYVAGYDAPGLMVIDSNGKTLHRVAQFGDYFWPYEMSIEDNMLTILFDSADNAKAVIDIRDYSYTIY